MIPAIGDVPAAGSWSEFTAQFTGSAANAGDDIVILLMTSGVQGNFDDFQLTAVPEPGYAGLLGLGLAGLLAFATVKRIRPSEIPNA